MSLLLVETNASLPQVGLRDKNTVRTSPMALDVAELHHIGTGPSGQFGQTFKPSQVTFGCRSDLHLQFDGD